MHKFHILLSKNVEISTLVNFYQCIFIEYACIKILYTKCIGKIWKFFGCFYHILPSKNPYISRLPAIWGVMFFWYMHLCTKYIKKNFYAVLCIFMHKNGLVFFFIYNVAKFMPKFWPFFWSKNYLMQKACQWLLCFYTTNCYQIFTKTLKSQNKGLFSSKN